ncbi:cytochrome bc1 complex diheme cytochrome c subunit [Phytohabitans aurantiacus]|jgi:ubiquinol-cytochrome c reductase cytochrome c subunit|uniref:Cytochrome bc1 complex cytochrome c subunit n=1 Tax=Phytohabitans aurantiacus TaxID=3016789 RepID=A0ABQ5RAT0_9ACTN|nr:cytochrome c [Phytohabitans aurantiacus]GLI03095.1 putative ubiquinol-cytochrome c reductase cytochrome c subunit [Phytohabitans aurantiacus]
MTSDSPGWLGRLRRGRSGPRSRVRRRVGSVVRLTLALTLAGGVYIVFAPGLAGAKDTPQLSTAAEEGKALFNQSCITCHGPNAQGVEGRGPSLIGVGAASVEFQVGTGRMPMARQEAQAERKPPVFTDEQTRQLAQYIQELGGGPQVPSGDLRAPESDEEAIARGGNLFRINCSSCHAFGGGGGALSSGKYAPGLGEATDQQIYAAMLTGPQNMPVFGDNQLTPEQKKEIISYIQEALKQDRDPGGWGLGRFGPVTEGLAIFLVGIVALVFASLWIAGKS